MRNRVVGTVLQAIAIVAVAVSGCAYRSTAIKAQAGTYWCPMHPDVRGSKGDACPRCGMKLTLASKADYRPYTLDFEVSPATLRDGEHGVITFRVRDADQRPVTRLELLHERVFHLFIVSHDLDHFAHIHPTQRRDGALVVDVTFPRAGPYRLIADFLPTGGMPQLVEKTFVTAGYQGDLGRSGPAEPDRRDKVVNGTRVRIFSPPSVAGREQLVTFELVDEVTGEPVRDLQPYLAATGHLLVLSTDLSGAFHSHPAAEVSSTVGPEIVFQLIFGRPGSYRLWLQFQRRGNVETVAFTLPVSPPE